MLFELRIKFDCDEGDEVAVMDLADYIGAMIEENTVVDVKSIELRAYSGDCREPGRQHATRN